MSTRTEIALRATLRLRADQLAKFRAMTGLDTEAKLAAAIGAHQATVNKVLRGRQAPSGQFIASLVSAFKGAAFDDLWEVTPLDETEEA